MDRNLYLKVASICTALFEMLDRRCKRNAAFLRASPLAVCHYTNLIWGMGKIQQVDIDK